MSLKTFIRGVFWVVVAIIFVLAVTFNYGTLIGH